MKKIILLIIMTVLISSMVISSNTLTQYDDYYKLKINDDFTIKLSKDADLTKFKYDKYVDKRDNQTLNYNNQIRKFTGDLNIQGSIIARDFIEASDIIIHSEGIKTNQSITEIKAITTIKNRADGNIDHNTLPSKCVVSGGAGSKLWCIVGDLLGKFQGMVEWQNKQDREISNLKKQNVILKNELCTQNKRYSWCRTGIVGIS